MSEVNELNCVSELVPPRASVLIEAMRDIGYSLEAAVADILDNSITADAEKIDIRFGWKGEAPWLAVIDDGAGMTESKLVEAMRPGSRSPLEKRDSADLGRFGLGLKTASFSQCRRLTVLSRKAGCEASRCWDLDVVSACDEWRLLTPTQDTLAQLPAIDELGTNGTYVLWQVLDRLDLGHDPAKSALTLNERMDSIREHLALVFHRFLSPGLKRKKLSLRINHSPVYGFDPFNTQNKATTYLAKESFKVDGESISLEAYILPHHSKVSVKEYREYAGREGYLRNQGFYVYRNHRLIIHGTWFRMAKQEPLTKLARVRVDIPNTLDHLWTIDVKKSRARPPEAIRRRLKGLVNKIRDSAKRPYTYRGRLVNESATTPLWRRRVHNERISYEINLQHPLLESFQSDLDENLRGAFEILLKALESAFPTTLLFADLASSPERSDTDGPRGDLLEKLAQFVVKTWSGRDADELSKFMYATEPFASNPNWVRENASRIYGGVS